MLKKESMARYLQTKGLQVQVYPCVSSTNTIAKECADQGAKEGLVIMADAQTDGRGRMGRSFCSPSGSGIYMSVLLRPSLAAEEVLCITTAAAVAVCRAIEAVSGRKAQIKWVNDVYCDGKKVCGILTEAAFKGRFLGYAVLGVGINVCDPKGGFPPEIADVAGSVFGKCQTDGNRLAAAVLDAFFEEYACLNEKRYIAEYRERSLLKGRRITVSKPIGDRFATAVEVDEQCRLVVRYDNGEEECLMSGDVRIRL